MNKISNLLTNILVIFLILMSIFSIWDSLNMILLIILSLISIIYLIVNRKNVKIDYIDIIFVIVPIIYLGIYIFDRKLVVDNYLSKLFQEILITINILALRRWLNKENMNNLLQIIVYISLINFFISFIFLTMPKIMNLLHIYVYFGDNFLNSIDRFYGFLLYPNASALVFLISSIYLIFAIINKSGNEKIDLVLLFINIIGLSFTYSKMQALSAFTALGFYILYNLIKKDYKNIKLLVNILLSVVIPIIYMQFAYRVYLININLFSFVLKLIFSILLFIGTFYLLNNVKNKTKYILVGGYAVICLVLVYNFVIPKSNSLAIKNVKYQNSIRITDFYLEDGKQYELKLNFNVNSISPKTKIQIERLHTSEYDVPSYEVVEEYDIKENVVINLTAKDNEYYNLKFVGLNEETNIVLNNFFVNDKEIKINSLFIPYQWLHQKDLTKYDKESVVSRFTFYKDSLMMLKENGFIVGHGYDCFIYYRDFYDLKYKVEEPHSFIFKQWLEIGIYSLVFLGIIMIKITINILKNYKNSEYLLYYLLFFVIAFVIPFDLIYSIIVMKMILYIYLIFMCDLKE